MYKTFAIPYSPFADKLAQLIEEKANELEGEGYEVVSFSVTPSARVIILAKALDNPERR